MSGIWIVTVYYLSKNVDFFCLAADFDFAVVIALNSYWVDCSNLGVHNIFRPESISQKNNLDFLLSEVFSGIFGANYTKNRTLKSWLTDVSGIQVARFQLGSEYQTYEYWKFFNTGQQCVPYSTSGLKTGR